MPCPTSTPVTVFPSAGWWRQNSPMGRLPLGALATTLIEASVSRSLPGREEDLEDKWSDLADEPYPGHSQRIRDKGGPKIAQGDPWTGSFAKWAAWAVEQGMGSQEDLSMSEEEGEMAGADPDAVSQRAKKWGQGQLGTLGSGNHFVEVQVVDRIYREEEARVMELSQGQVVVSDSFGIPGPGPSSLQRLHPPDGGGHGPVWHQAARSAAGGGALEQPRGEAVLGAMAAAANYAWANRASPPPTGSGRPCAR